ncbi:MAG TPA: SpoIIE family protein phosphatase [Jatrophihabitans sp.]|nr:SpoIIE family protein phosphatase [Jatrophihabitans sp.]
MTSIDPVRLPATPGTAARLGIDDPARLLAVRDTGLLDTDPEQIFDGLTELAASVLNAPYALVTLVDDRRSFWKSRSGVADPELMQSAIEDSFCQYVVSSGQPLIVGDAATDPLTAGNPAISQLGVAAWAGFPLRSAQGHTLGTFCVVDTRVREWTGREVEILRVLADAANREISLRQSMADAELANAKLSLLVEAGQLLAETTDLPVSLERLTHLVVPLLGDWCVISVVDEDGHLADRGWWHHDEASRELVSRFVGNRLVGLNEDGATNRARLSKRPVIVESGALEAGLAVLRSPEARAAYQQLAPVSYAVFPMTAGNRVNGVLAILRDGSRPPMTPVAIEVASGVAQRAGLALENARLFEAQRVAVEHLAMANARIVATAKHDRIVARALQDALLPNLIDSDELELSARYLTADGADQVGGDFYDVIVTDGGATSLVIGDVSGHDIGAAAEMGRITNMLRAMLWQQPEGSPAEVLAQLDRAMRDFDVRTMSTAALVHIEGPNGTGHRAVRWSNAGHLPPMLVQSDGTVRALTGRPDRPLAVDPRGARHDHQDVMPVDATLLVYTDGLVETPQRDVDTGLEQLRQYLQAHCGDPLESLVDGVLSELIADQPTDDVAVVALRLRQ